MPTVVIENASHMGLLESDTDIVVLLDDEKKLKFSRDQKVEFLTEAGAHRLQVRVGKVHSLPTNFRAETGDVIGFECSRSGIWQKHVVLTSLYHNRSHERFNIENTGVLRESYDSQASKKVEHTHWFEILDVAPHASMEQIETAYQKLMKHYAPERFAEVAYEDSEAMEREGRLINAAYEAARSERQP